MAGLHGEALKIRLAAPPVDGKANACLIAFLADRLAVARSAVSLQGTGVLRRGEWVLSAVLCCAVLMQAIARRGAPLLAHALLLSVAIGSPGCGGDSQSVNAPPVAEKSVELQAAIERVIPIEAVYLLGAGEAAAPPDARLRVQRTIASMNRPFQRAGVQFYLRSYREVSGPVLAKIQFDNESLEFWAPSTGDKVRDDVTNIWGTNPWPSRPAGNMMAELKSAVKM